MFLLAHKLAQHFGWKTIELIFKKEKFLSQKMFTKRSCFLINILIFMSSPKYIIPVILSIIYSTKKK